ncbi:hypothetical protein ACFLTI_05880 [Bacteroidota bacterium]
MNKFKMPDVLFGKWTDDENDKVISISRGINDDCVIINDESEAYVTEALLRILGDNNAGLIWHDIQCIMQIISNNRVLITSDKKVYDFTRLPE